MVHVATPPTTLGHARPHDAQLAGSFKTSVQPLLQSVVPIGHIAEQTPITHVATDAHASPQPPQFAESVVMSVQRPLQSICGIMHGVTHVPAAHTPDEQKRPHVPQFWASIEVSVQRPAQSDWGRAHISCASRTSTGLVGTSRTAASRRSGTTVEAHAPSSRDESETTTTKKERMKTPVTDSRGLCVHGDQGPLSATIEAHARGVSTEMRIELTGNGDSLVVTTSLSHYHHYGAGDGAV